MIERQPSHLDPTLTKTHWRQILPTLIERLILFEMGIRARRSTAMMYCRVDLPFLTSAYSKDGPPWSLYPFNLTKLNSAIDTPMQFCQPVRKLQSIFEPAHNGSKFSHKASTKRRRFSDETCRRFARRDPGRHNQLSGNRSCVSLDYPAWR